MYVSKNQRPWDCPQDGYYGESVVSLDSPHLAEQGSMAQQYRGESREYSRLMQQPVHRERGCPADAAVLPYELEVCCWISGLIRKAIFLLHLIVCLFGFGESV